MKRTLCVSVDLDEIGCYHRIHGLPPPEGDAAAAVWARALERHLALFDAMGVPATFFVVGGDLGGPNAARVRAIAARGHEIGNHTLGHRYDFVRLDEDEIRREVRGGIEAIEAAIGARPVGFRAPGYHVTDAVLRVLADEGTAYDSSTFPSAPYFAAKAIALGAMRIAGRHSDSILGRPDVVFSPRGPHRRAGLVEIPIGVVPGIGVPFIGTTLALAGETGARLLAHAMSARRFVNLELHGIDLCDADEDGLGALRGRQPDLARSGRAKTAAIRAAIETFVRKGYGLALLRDVSV